ncbi:MAG TPA: hypothetical protein VMS74_07830 [Acidimicrobiia bacterium]|nr:hypothetical protein [Acidimicrobiia bacterium]
MTDIMSRLTRANPSPPATRLPEGLMSKDALRSIIDDRRGIVQTIKPPTTTTAQPRTRLRTVTAIAAFAVVAIVIGVTAFMRTSESPVGADAPFQPAADVAGTVETLPSVTPAALVGAAPIEVTEAYLNRVASRDLSGALSLFSQEFIEGGSAGFTDAEGLMARMAGHWVTYNTTLNGTLQYECAESTPAGTVRCLVTLADDLSRGLGIADSEYEWVFRVESGLIASASPFPTLSLEGLGESRFSEYGAVMSQYDSWGRDNHFEEYIAACRSGADVPSWTVACAEFRLTHLEAFAETIGN